jgi:hypothetical protein
LSCKPCTQLSRESSDQFRQAWLADAKLEFAIRQWWFELTLPAKLDKAEADWHEAQPRDTHPMIVEHPIDDTVQTGDSRLLGGGMSIHAPWKRDH